MSDVKVSRDGTVTRDGKVIGSVPSRMGHGSIGAAIMGVENRKQWVPTLPDGTEISGPQDTRKRAVSILDRYTTPTGVTDIKIGSDYFTGKPFVSATLTHEGNTMGVSSYAHEVTESGERLWAVDFMWTRTGIMPAWSHGEGDRTVRKQCINSELAAIVTAATGEFLARLSA